MARPGQVLDNPVSGERLVFRRTAAETGGELLEVEASWEPRSHAPPDHYHPSQSEQFEVLAGTLRAVIGGEEREFAAGEKFEIEPGAHHRMWNPGPGPARALWQVRPALDTEGFFAEIWGLAEAGKVNDKGLPALLDLVAILRRHNGEFRPARPAWPVLRVVLALLAPFARGRGLPEQATRMGG